MVVSNASAKMDQGQLSCMEQNNVTLADVQEESRRLHTRAGGSGAAGTASAVPVFCEKNGGRHNHTSSLLGFT